MSFYWGEGPINFVGKLKAALLNRVSKVNNVKNWNVLAYTILSKYIIDYDAIGLFSIYGETFYYLRLPIYVNAEVRDIEQCQIKSL